MIGLNRKPEVFVAGASGYITPMDMLTPATAAPAAAGGGYGYGGGDSQAVNVYAVLEINGQQVSLLTKSARADTQDYARRNGRTGFVGVGK